MDSKTWGSPSWSRRRLTTTQNFYILGVGMAQYLRVSRRCQNLDQDPIFLLEIGPIPFLGLDLIESTPSLVEVKNLNLRLANFNQQVLDSNASNSNSTLRNPSTPNNNSHLPPDTQSYSRGPRRWYLWLRDELYSKGSLGRWIQSKGPIPPQSSWRYSSLAEDGLHHWHLRAGWVHPSSWLRSEQSV